MLQQESVIGLLLCDRLLLTGYKDSLQLLLCLLQLDFWCRLLLWVVLGGLLLGS